MAHSQVAEPDQAANPPAIGAKRQEPVPAEQIEELIITGSRIRRTDLAADSAVSIIGEDELRLAATVNVEDAIRELPQSLPGQTPYTNNGNPGAATVNLRGLAAERTLVLVNGKRFVGYDSEGIVDVNNIPASLVERIDVVTGGASAVYGSDAMAGVVNFILKPDFEGVLLEGTYTSTGRGDGALYDLNATFGRNFAGERANLTLFVGWTERDAVSQADRAYSEQTISSRTGLPDGSRVDSNGSFRCAPRCQDPGSFGPTNFVAFDANRDLAPPGSRRFNFAPYNLLQVPEERVQSTALGRFDFTDQTRLYSRATFAHTRIHTEIAPSGTFFTEYDFPFDYPFWTPQALRVFADRDGNGLLDQFESNGLPGFQPADFVGPSGEPGDQGDVGTLGCPSCAGNNLADPGEYIRAAYGRRLVESGPRISENETLAYQVLAGLEGELPLLTGWSWDLSYQYGRTELSRRFRNDVSNPHIQAMLNGCPASAPPGCVVGNLFGEGGLSQAAVDFIALDIAERIETDQQVLSFAIDGDLGDRLAIVGGSPIGVALGAEWRRETSASFPNECYATPGCSPGFGTTFAVSSAYDVKEVFAELLVPLLEEKRWASELSFEAGVRYSDYSTVGGVTAFKLGGTYAPVEQLRVRAMFQRAVRAPNIFEFGSNIVPSSGDTLGDPCAAFSESSGSTTVSADVRDLCVATGAPAAAFTPLPTGDYTTTVPDAFEGTTVNSFSGGNPDLREEESDTLTLGLVYEPDLLPGASLQLDWYRIKIHDAIVPLGEAVIVSGCYDTAYNPSRDPGARLCDLVSRNPITGGLVGDPAYGVIANQQNAARVEVEGIDLAIDAAVEFGRLGEIEFSFQSTYVMKIDELPVAGFPVNHCKGLYGNTCGFPNASVRFTQRTTWTRGAFSAGYRWRFIQGTESDEQAFDLDGDGVLDPLCSPRYCATDGTHYVDLVFDWTPETIPQLANFQLTLGIENVFDEDPPIVGSSNGPVSGNTFPDMYDPLGRTLTLRISKKF